MARRGAASGLALMLGALLAGSVAAQPTPAGPPGGTPPGPPREAPAPPPADCGCGPSGSPGGPR